MRHILGLSAFYHDSAAALLSDGRIIAAAQEERFTREKNDERFPKHAIQSCLGSAGLSLEELDAVVFYDKPISKFARMIESYLATVPYGLWTFPLVMPGWLGEKLNLRKTIRDELTGLRCPVLFTGHHQAHAASAFYPSPFNESAILTVDGVGEWATATIGSGRGNEIQLLKELRFPHSPGLLYSAFTAYCGFRVNSGEYKLMGLAPYGEPKYADLIRDQLIDLKPDGSFKLNLDYFGFLRGFSMTNERFHRLFGGPPRAPEAAIDPRHMDVARSIQEVIEEILLRLARHAREVTGQTHLCLAGGVALNCVANGRILREKIFERLWIQPAAGDAGGALGAALALWHSHAETQGQARLPAAGDSMQGSLLGPEFSDEFIQQFLQERGAVFERLPGDVLLDRVAGLLQREKVVGWFQGRMEFGPRALGSRSILGDARSPRMQSILNLKIKFRESFRPFAPLVRRERVSDYFDLDEDSPYMLLVAPVKSSLRRAASPGVRGFDLLRYPLSVIPAVTHVDYSARVQTVSREKNVRLYTLLEKFEQATGCGVLVNTSFNVRDEPIVCTPDDAYRCFMNTDMDALVIGDHLLLRGEQPGSALRQGRAPSRSPALRAGVRPLGPRLKENPREWQKFVLVWALALFALMVGWWLRGRASPGVYAAVLLSLAVTLVWCGLKPGHFRGVYRRGMTLNYHIGQFLGKAMLAIVYLVVLTPFGGWLRLTGKDLLDLKRAPGAASYWRPARTSAEFDRLY